MKTVTVKGKVYQIGKLYIDDRGELGRLTDTDEDNFIVASYKGGTSWHSLCANKINPEVLGTIEDAPIELEAGDWWLCHYEIQTANESWSHHDKPFEVGPELSFLDVPENAAFFTPKKKMVLES